MDAVEHLKKTQDELAAQPIKCIVWDLDNTIWKGVLLEDDNVQLVDGIVDLLQKLDNQGILNSIASKNDYATAMSKLKEFRIEHYFLYPEIHWNPKSDSIRKIAKSLNISLDTFAFVDDQPFERHEVAFEHHSVMCIDSTDIKNILKLPRMIPRFVTQESKLRREMYMSDMIRNQAEVDFQGNNEAFLKTLELVFSIKSASEEDLQRVEELTIRTHQLNTTGYTYSYDELNEFRHSSDHLLLVSKLEDRFGTYGTIGLALIDLHEKVWTIKLLLMSCRVLSRGVGSIMMTYIMNKAKKAGVRLQAHFVPTPSNRMMYVTYKFANFKEIENGDNLIVLENDLMQIQSFPSYIEVMIDSA